MANRKSIKSLYSKCDGCRRTAYLSRYAEYHLCDECIEESTENVGEEILPQTLPPSHQADPAASGAYAYASSGTRHCLWTLKGSQEAKDMFMGTLKFLTDRNDFPLDPMHKPLDTVLCCTVCGGVVWKNPVRSPKDLRALAKQLGLKIKVQVWKRAFKCDGPLEYRSYKSLPIGIGGGVKV